ncbi:MAG: FHA domain-containing protein [Syntrophomonadaceae bacterium]
MNLTRFFIKIKNGSPYETNTDIYLPVGQLLIGRPWDSHQPDIGFTSEYISKRHALLSCYEGPLQLTDLNSKHGTLLNGIKLVPHRASPLRNGDTISLAHNSAVFTLHEYYTTPQEHTVEILSTNRMDSPDSGLVIDCTRREVRCQGELLALHGKEADLLMLLYKHRNRAVSYDEIKNHIWPERICPSTTLADVGNEEINALIYRLRKRLNSFSCKVINIPRYGYRLDL